MRILDSETHPIVPAGVDAAYRDPAGPPDRATIRRIAEESIASVRFDDLAAGLLAEMDRNGVEKALVMRGALATPNDHLSSLVRAHRDRFAAFASWGLSQPADDPVQESEAALAELDRALSDPVFVGVGEVSLARRFAPKLAPAEAVEAFVPTLEICRRRRRPILFHTGSAGPATEAAYRDPLNLEPLVGAYPDVAFIVAHLGGSDAGLAQKSIELARAHRNVYLTASVTLPEHVELAVSKVGAGRVLFGSDWSGSRPVVEHDPTASAFNHAIEVIRRAGIDDHDRELILGVNLAELVGI